MKTSKLTFLQAFKRLGFQAQWKVWRSKWGNPEYFIYGLGACYFLGLRYEDGHIDKYELNMQDLYARDWNIRRFSLKKHFKGIKNDIQTTDITKHQ